MAEFRLPAALKFNRGPIRDPSAYARETGSLSWLYLVGDELRSSMEALAGSSYDPRQTP